MFKKYFKDIKTKRAVERDIEIIGEAVNRITKKDKEFQLDFFISFVRFCGFCRLSNIVIILIVVSETL